MPNDNYATKLSSGKTPKDLTIKLLSRCGISIENNPPYSYNEIPRASGFSVTVPGAPAGWLDCVQKFGSGMSLEELFLPAIQLAENGYPVHEVSARLQQLNSFYLKNFKNSYGNDLLINGNPPKAGQILKNSKLASVLKELAKTGKEAFYKGRVAEAVVTTVQENGGCLTMSDMENHSSTFNDLIIVDYQGYKIWEMLPDGEGIIPSMGLNIFEDFNLGKESRMSASCIHKMIEATKHVYGEKFRNKIDHSDEPPETILSKSHTDDARNISILNSIASSNYCPSINDGSIYFSVVDNDGNACSFINSLYHYFGSGLVPENCGFALQCRAMDFSLDEKYFNCVAPEKLPHHATIPGIATYGPDNDFYACFGLIGGYIQPQGHLQLLSNLIDYNMTPQSALCYPRVNVSFNYDAAPIVNIEQGISEEIVKQLIKLGHKVAIVSGIDRIKFGRGQIIQVQHDDQGNRVYWCGSDSRADGCAIGF